MVDDIDNIFFMKQCLRNYSRSEVETLHVVTVRWNADAATID